jgi:hypothetical protein
MRALESIFESAPVFCCAQTPSGVSIFYPSRSWRQEEMDVSNICTAAS